jgi:hypothetical protein
VESPPAGLRIVLHMSISLLDFPSDRLGELFESGRASSKSTHHLGRLIGHTEGAESPSSRARG